MGRRKERRLAAISAAGRRVKLDLFAEPSGDMGDSSVQEGVGGEGDSRTRTELPSSPYSSGRQPQNPLRLLEQYSDEESEDGSTEGQNHAVSQGTLNSMDKEAIVSANEDTGNDDGKENSQTVDELLINDDTASQDPSRNHEEVLGIDSDDLQQRQASNVEETTYTTTSDDCLVGDMSSAWKMVLHEESNQYYYWNIVTGETSWEVPAVFAQTVTSVERADDDSEGNMDAATELEKSNTPLYMEEDHISKEVGVESNVSCQNSEGAAVQGTEDTKMDGSHEGFIGEAMDGEEGNKDAKESDGNSLLGGHSVENRSGTELPSQLIKQCEGLLERLNSVKGLNCHTENLKLKRVLEIEIRLADIKALASHGSSLLTFWLHSEGQLKQLEAAVDDAIKRHHSASPSGFEAEVDSRKKSGFAAVEPHAVSMSAKNSEARDFVSTPTECYPVNDVGEKSVIIETAQDSELPPRPILHSVEDMDMDVDMEVEDTSAVNLSHGGALSACVSTVPSSLHNNQAEQESLVPEKVFGVTPVGEWIPPPPPDSEPFPPPPPDDEPFPPPPPVEPPETSYPPSAHLGIVQAFPYSEQCPPTYPGSGLEYYGQTNLDVSASTLYTHPEGGQVTISHLPQYYEAVPNVFSVNPLGVNLVDSTAYYGSQSATLSQVPLISGAAEDSNAQNEPIPENRDSKKQGLLDPLAQGGSSLLAKSCLNDGKSGNGTVMASASAEVPDSQPTVGAPATSSMVNGDSVTSTSDTTSSASAAAAAAAAAAASKAQSKVSRSKKRTVATGSSLRSNKKVSTLVDKWKAAKEELQEEEEEPENAYEILERKRQREIEEWRAQQIASGEAQDNANFQPLGGDWRERVKRRRAERMKEKKQSASPPSGNQKKIDLVEHSKGLPSGWQAYWDDSLKKVYYGNVLTSETTWTRPAD